MPLKLYRLIEAVLMRVPEGYIMQMPYYDQIVLRMSVTIARDKAPLVGDVYNIYQIG